MKKRNILISLPLLFLSLITLAAAANNLPSFIFGDFFGMIWPSPWSEVVIVLAVFIMLFAAFGDIIQNFTLFSPRTAWIIGGCLALIAAITRAVLSIAYFLAQITAGLGVISMFIAIITAFIAFAIIHIASGKLGGLMWALKRQKAIDLAKQKGMSMGTAAKALLEFQKTLKK